MNEISQFFHKYSTYEKFHQNLEGGLINKDAICFIEDRRQIYAQGKLYSVSKQDFEETNKILQIHQTILNEITGVSGSTTEQSSLIDNIKEINRFLNGYNTSNTLNEILDVMHNAISLEIDELQKDMQNKILDFAIKMDTFTNEVADKISKYDKDIEKIDGLYQSMRTQYTELSVKFTDLQEELLGYKSIVDNLRTQHEQFESDTNDNFRTQALRLTSVENAMNAIDTRFQQVTDKYAEVMSKLNEIESAGIETRQKINALELSKGMAGGLATLDNSGHVPSVQLPSYVDDILEFSSMEFFPTVGESGKLYLDKMTNKQYRWSGTQYTEIPKTIAIGETSSTAYAGDKGKKVTEDLISHKEDTDNPHNVSKYQIGLSNVDNTSDLAKPVSLAVQAIFDSLDEELEIKFNDVSDDIDSVDSKIDNHIKDKLNPHSVTKSQIGLGNVNNTSDVNKPISTATQNALNNKVDKVTGKGLSTNDFTDTLKTKLDGLENYTLPIATSTVLGGIKTNYTSNGKYYKVSVNTSGNAYVYVPWSDTNTTYSNATTSSDGLMSSGDKTKLDSLSNVTVDSAMSSSSTNPVQNKVIYSALSGKADSSHTHSYLSTSGGTITGNLTLKGSSNYGNKLNFGDGDYVHISEPTDDYLEIKGNNGINFVTSSGVSTLNVNGSSLLSAVTGNLSVASTTANGLMSSSDKTKLNIIPSTLYAINPNSKGIQFQWKIGSTIYSATILAD